MPSGPPELHEKWTKRGPTEAGDTNATLYLESRGYKMSQHWNWFKPSEDHVPTEEEIEALNYLVWEWDYGGLEG
jgi:hypothetical protein